MLRSAVVSVGSTPSRTWEPCPELSLREPGGLSKGRSGSLGLGLSPCSPLTHWVPRQQRHLQDSVSPL